MQFNHPLLFVTPEEQFLHYNNLDNNFINKLSTKCPD